jgi:tetratricopeptide (TPR) repeat protein
MSNVAPPPGHLAAAVQRLRGGDLAGARSAAEEGLRERPDEAALLEIAGLASAQLGEPAAALPHFRRLLELAPANRGARINLAIALTATGKFEEAAQAAGGDDDPRLRRILAYALQQGGRLAEAAAVYEALVGEDPRDFESWNNLGNARSALGDVDGSILAFRHALGLRRDIVPMYINFSEVLASVDRDQERQAVMREAARIAPGNADVQTELGLAEAGARDLVAAEQAFREAIRLSPGFTPAFLELALLLEDLNRLEDLTALLAEAESRCVGDGEIGFVKAWLLRRQNRFDEALQVAETIPTSINPVRRLQLLAELYDRAGDSPRAFAAFEGMNAASVAAKPAPGDRSYRQEIAERASKLTADAVAAWRPLAIEPLAAPPIFIVGFPRSGTTLLDTLLMNVPALHVMEELPAFQHVEAAFDEERLGVLTDDEAKALRERYVEAVRQLSPPGPGPGQRIVDKHPLHMARMPSIHRLFPEAKIILVERHPCDAVLSCFMSNFTLNRAMRSFVDLEEAARTYDTVFTMWSRSEELLALDVHRVRYERMVDDLEAEMRPLLAFLGIAWDPRVLDNIGSAARRSHIRTASYSQVTEPIYRRSAGRWSRYREQMAPVLPILAPWADRLGYEM